MADDTPILAGKRCLVLEDEFLIALDIQQLLETAGATSIVSVGTVAEALDALNDGSRFDMVILDVKVGGEGGSSMTVAAMLSEQGTPFVFLTGLRAEEVKVGAFAAVPVVEKPYQATTLIEALRGALTPA
ncbi:MAG TPA: response regulator [Pseudolabrys sp.]|nr:response regulator [Pseudolabrys sp.]